MGNCDVNKEAPSPNTKEYSKNNDRERFVVRTVNSRVTECDGFSLDSADDDTLATDSGNVSEFISTEAKQSAPATIATFASPIADESGPLEAEPST
jgi:hypothetical protein